MGRKEQMRPKVPHFNPFYPTLVKPRSTKMDETYSHFMSRCQNTAVVGEAVGRGKLSFMFVFPARGSTFAAASNVPTESPSRGLVFGWVVVAVVVSNPPVTGAGQNAGPRRQRERGPADLAW
jgi:hypothetical protein